MSHFRFYFWIAFIALIISPTTFAQSLSELNFIYPDSSLIKANGIKSLLVISDFAEDGIEQSTYTTTNKWMEFAFNENGQRSYVRTYPMFQEYGDLGNISSKWQWFSYDENQRIRSQRDKTERQDQTIHFQYDDHAKLTEFVIEQNGVQTYRQTYNWKNSEVAEVNYEQFGENRTNETRFFNKDGTFKELKSDYGDFKMKYERKDSVLTTITEWFREGERQLYHITSTDERTKRTIYSLQIKKNQDTSSIVQARYDSKGNITYFKKLDYSNRRNYEEYSPSPVQSGNGETIQPTKNPIPDPFTVCYRITNEYDSRGLLIKQRYFKIDENKSSEIQVASIYLIYDTAALIVQPIPIEEEEER